MGRKPGRHGLPGFRPNFSNYDVVVSNLGFGAADWPEATRASFEQFMRPNNWEGVHLPEAQQIEFYNMYQSCYRDPSGEKKPRSAQNCSIL